MKVRNALYLLYTVVVSSVYSAAAMKQMNNTADEKKQTVHLRVGATTLPVTCPGRLCEGDRPPTNGLCHCDKLCEVLGDCCLNYKLGPLNTSYAVINLEDVMEERRESIQHAGRPSALQCLDLPILLENYDLATVAKFRSVSTCSAFFDPGCPFSGFVPYCTRSYIYQNRFCALCNNVTEEIWPLREVFECPDYVTKFTESLRKQRPVAFRELAIKMCHRVFQFPPECKAVAERMRCFVDKDDCVLTPNKTSAYYNACVAYSDPVYVKDKYYKNPFCFLCEGGKFEGNRCTDDTPIQQPFKFTPAFSFLLDLDGDHILSDFIQWQDNAASTNIAGTAAPAPYLTVLIIFGASISAT